MSDNKEHKCVDKEELLTRTKSNIEKYGIQVIMVRSTNYLPSFAYSIGLYQSYKHPEVICFSLSDDLGHSIINDIADIVKSGENIKANKTYNNIFENSSAVFLQVDKRNINDYFGAGINFYNTKDFPAFQLVWTDRNNKFPWENNFEEEFLYKQPLLDRNADFKFREAKNLAVFTTRQWLELGKPILRVVHDDDGDWQFLTGDQTLGDASIVALEQMVIKDKTLNEVFNLDYGEEAERDFVGGQWTRKKVEYDEEDQED